jgi:hypothetical protein
VGARMTWVPRRQDMRPKLVLEIRGGTLVGFYTNQAGVEAHLVDWDDVDADSPPRSTRLSIDRLEDMPQETIEAMKGHDRGRKAFARQ